ncbi:Por secretion system C-terminal sorting domain-containing protein [Aquimarina amphilecti]|uniref:Por secretion system C-terminal sorting domain-containing protein n=1 Tax=Aquimarina amphilecti TaxID=1038014 RepID=A0A1H7T814_AQUAM|nr:carbohydrate-binding protein [Aquimarina amphilecti]SEL80655.1 Por secretion system C-terminal sorting domain-containing protein [Aquimarina amphilecti]
MKKNTNLLLVLMLCFVAVNVFAQPAAPNGKKWEKIDVMSDEFNGSSLNTNKWAINSPQWEGRKPARFETSSVSVGNGDLKISASKKTNPFNGWTHNGGLVRSLTKNTYGYYETRMKGNKTFMSSTFWLINQRNEGSGCNLRVTELDITETVGVNSNGANWVNNMITNMNSNTHSRNTNCNNTPVGQQGNKAPLGEASWKNYHTYGVWWKSKSEILFYLDGQFVGQIKPPADFNLPMYLRMVVETYDWNPPKGGQDGMNNSLNERTTYYDWVRSYKLVNDNNPNNPPTVKLTTPVNGASYQVGQTIPLAADAADSDGTISKVEFFINNNLTATEQVVPYQTSTTINNVGNYTITAKATDNNGAVTTSQSVNVTIKDDSTPPGNVINIPGSFEAEDFESKSGSVRVENTPGTSGKNLGFIKNGDYVDYIVNVDTTSEYTLDIFASSQGTGGKVDILESGSIVSSVNIPVTGQWHSYKKYSSTISLTSGEKTLRLSFKGGAGYLYNIDKVVATKIQQVEQTVTLTPIHDAYLQGSTRYNLDMIRIEHNRRSGYLMFDLSSINGTITKADLKFTVYSDAGNGNIAVSKGNSNNWTETNLSNSNKPGKGTQLGSLNTNLPIGSTKTIPLKTAQILGNKISLVIDALSGNDFAFASKENTSATKPQLVVTYTTNRSEENTSNIIKLYPNPVINTINFSSNMEGQIVKVFNVNGVLMKETVLEDGQNSIDVTSLSSGYYIINVLEAGKSNKLIVSKKIVKQ